jgi:predicted ATPase/DNA-binding CsgD family transcriptional regulator
MTTHDRPVFGQSLRRHRLAVGLTREALARRAGLSARGIADLERGSRRFPYRDTVQRLADALVLDVTQRAVLVTAARRASIVSQTPSGAPLGAFGHNLPVALTSFIGRERELADVQARLADARLLTLTGVAGCGKTRLALEVAWASLDHFSDGVWLVQLAPLADPALVQRSVAAVVGVRDTAGQSIVSALAARLRGKRVLLVLDNCEHLLDACAQLMDALLRACSDVTVLATSREALGLTGEVAWRVPSLPVPDPRRLPPLPELQQNAAVQLFVERAMACQPHFVLTERNAPAVAQICQRLDGIPLALELGAGRMDGLTAEQLAARLDERFRLLTGGSRAALPRQQTLRATVDWSYDLLSDPERRLLNRLSVFAGGWTLEAAEAVCAGDGIEREEVVDLLLQLVRKSLVVAREGGDGAERYRLLETLRQYARGAVAGGRRRGDTAAAARQLFPDLRRQAGSGAHPSDQMVGCICGGRVQRPWPSRARAGQSAHSLAMVDRLPCWRACREAGGCTLPDRSNPRLNGRRTHLATGSVDPPAVAEERAAREQILAFLGLTANRAGEYATADAAAQGLLESTRATGDRFGVANALVILAVIHFNQADYAQARACLEESQAVAAAVEDNDLVVNWRYVDGGIALHEGRLDDARVLFNEAMAIRESGSLFAGWAKKDLGWVMLEQGAYPEARSLLEQSLQTGEDFGNTLLLAYSLEGFSSLAAALGQHDRAICLAGAGAALREATGDPLPPTWQRMLEHWLAISRAALSAAAAAAAWKIGHAMPLEEAIGYAREPIETTLDTAIAPAEPATTSAPDRLTRREREVAALVAEGLTNGQIAGRLVITQRTVAAHIEHILNKLGFASRTQVGVWAAEHHLIAPNLA